VDAPIGVETGLNPGLQWGSWLGTLDSYAARWLAQSTVVRQAPGVSLVRLPNLGSPSAIPHVTVAGAAAPGDGCGVLDFAPSGADELVRVACVDGAGRPKDVRFIVFVAEPSAGPAPMAAIRSDAPGDGVRITRLGPGSYRATVPGEAFNGLGYAQVTALGAAPVRCQNAAVTAAGGALTLQVSCREIGTGAPADSDWLATYVQGAPLSHDTRQPGGYAQTAAGPDGLAIDPARSFSSSGGAITLVRDGTGRYRVRFAGLARVAWGDPLLASGQSAQVVTLGDAPGSCRLLTVGHQNAFAEVSVAEVQVACDDAAGHPADVPFAAALLRRP
jgi:hypothetical protein